MKSSKDRSRVSGIRRGTAVERAGISCRTIMLVAAALSILIPCTLISAGEPEQKEEKKKAEAPLSPAVKLIKSMSFKEMFESGKTNIPLKLEEVPAIKSLLWAKYSDEQKRDPKRVQEHNSKQIKYFSSVMRYEYRRIGSRPKTGYPLYIALHGGGGCPAHVNDGQWNHMKGLYAGSVRNGIYLAPRGISNGPGLHAEANSFPMYDRLIENMILFEGVDPNRVYVLGFSAGGDGVYQISPRMADRFGAANMSGGHHNSVNPANLYNLPFLMQVGERDKAYGRNRATVNYSLRLDDLQRAHPDGYVHAVYVHAGRGHGFNDRGGNQTIFANPEGWMHKNDRATKSVDTNAIRWLSRHTRNPLPKKVVWELSTRANNRWRCDGHPDGKSFWLSAARGRQFYWLDLTRGDMGGTIVARIDKPTNTVIIDQPARWLRILLSGQMLDLSKPVNVKILDKQCKVSRTPNLKTLVHTLADRGDPNYMFEADIVIERSHVNIVIGDKGGPYTAFTVR